MRRPIVFAILLMLFSACGGVDVAEVGDEALKVLSLSPRADETGVAQNTEVVVVFSDQVSTGDGEDNVNSDTFYLEEVGGGVVTGVTLTPSSLDADSTIVLSGLSLDSGTAYEIVVRASVTGNNTEAIGVEVRSAFRTVD
ncbi:MAG: Ig-like domain-containing protein [Deltaproteobacteria bacterium]|nr:Ig-like domain-containing protein [Deltaproteobacteria bacterium]